MGGGSRKNDEAHFRGGISLLFFAWFFVGSKRKCVRAREGYRVPTPKYSPSHEVRRGGKGIHVHTHHAAPPLAPSQARSHVAS